MYHKSRSYRIFNVINISFLILIAIMCIVPMIHVLAVSFSNKVAADANLVSLWPVGFSSKPIKTMNNPIFLNSLWISLLRTVIGTGITLLITFLAAYPLSKENSEFKGRTVYS